MDGGRGHAAVAQRLPAAGPADRVTLHGEHVPEEARPVVWESMWKKRLTSGNWPGERKLPEGRAF